MRTALVLGSGAGVWDDVEAALSLGEFDVAVGCNDIGVEWPGRLDAWVSLHPEKFNLWRARREQRGLPPHKALYGHLEATTAPADVLRTDRRFPGQINSGSSGLFAVKVALVDLGFDRAVLCGVPMTAQDRHFFDAREWRGAQVHRKGWVQALPVIRDRARSMSGWTREVLGAPDEEWLGQ